LRREAGFSGFLGETFALLRDAAVSVAVFIVLLGGLNAVGAVLGLVELDRYAAGIGFAVSFDQGLAAGLFQLALFAAEVVALYFLAAKMLEVRNRLRPGGSNFLNYLGMYLLSLLGFVVGFVLLIVPGLILLVRWSAATGFVIGARQGAAASLRASWNATRGHGWSIFFSGAVLLAGVLVGMAAAGGFSDPSEAGVLAATVSSFVDAAGSAILTAFGIAVFLLVHSDAGELGDVFA
jgi:hypothetical protein